ncbi:hypothetical protein C2S51_032556 [Perilla frutescens var. frutescens]|nr:hypothetical protein C2S51_032556 [Perilla frutescens var. frutescens]
MILVEVFYPKSHRRYRSHDSTLSRRVTRSPELIKRSNSEGSLKNEKPKVWRMWIPKNMINLSGPDIMQEKSILSKKKVKDTWYLDSRCSKHMIGDKNDLDDYKEVKGPLVTFGDNSKIQTIGKGFVVKGKVVINSVSHVEGLKHKLLSISQLCGNGYSVDFNNSSCDIRDKSTGAILLTGKKLVDGLPKEIYKKISVCGPCQKGKQVKSSFKNKSHHQGTTDILQLLHVDLFRPVKPPTPKGKNFTLVVVDDYSRYTWMEFQRSKDETFAKLSTLIRRLQTDKGKSVQRIRSDNGTEFVNQQMINFLSELGITHEHSAARTPQQNCVAEWRNHTLNEAARAMVADANIAECYWAEAVNITCHTQNRSAIVITHDKPPYELFKATNEQGENCTLVQALPSENLLDYVDHIVPEQFEASLEVGIETNSRPVEDNLVNEDTNCDETSNLITEIGGRISEDDEQAGAKAAVDGPADGVAEGLVEGTTEEPSEGASEATILKWLRSHPVDKIIGDPRSRVQTRGSTEHALFTCSKTERTAQANKKQGVKAEGNPAGTDQSKPMRSSVIRTTDDVSSSMPQAVAEFYLNSDGYNREDSFTIKVRGQEFTITAETLDEMFKLPTSGPNLKDIHSDSESDYKSWKRGNATAQLKKNHYISLFKDKYQGLGSIASKIIVGMVGSWSEMSESKYQICAAIMHQIKINWVKFFFEKLKRFVDSWEKNGDDITFSHRMCYLHQISLILEKQFPDLMKEETTFTTVTRLDYILKPRSKSISIKESTSQQTEQFKRKAAPKGKQKKALTENPREPPTDSEDDIPIAQKFGTPLNVQPLRTVDARSLF